MPWSKTRITVATVLALLLVNSALVVIFMVVQNRSTELLPLPTETGASNDANVPTTASMPAPSGEYSEDEVVLTTFVPPRPDKDGFLSLFNGRDLSGWNYNPHIWSVSNGVIIARAPLDSRSTGHYMAWAGGEVQDFELRLKVRTTAGANSGVPVRARWSGQRWLPGYQAEINRQQSGLFVIAGTGRERQLSRAGWRTVAREENGIDILDAIEQLPDADKIEAVRAAVRNGEWSDVSVVAHDTRFVVQVNGVTVVDTRDDHPVKFVPVGMLGLEYSHKQGTNDAVEFKEIRLKL